MERVGGDVLGGDVAVGVVLELVLGLAGEGCHEPVGGVVRHRVVEEIVCPVVGGVVVVVGAVVSEAEQGELALRVVFEGADGVAMDVPSCRIEPLIVADLDRVDGVGVASGHQGVEAAVAAVVVGGPDLVVVAQVHGAAGTAAKEAVLEGEVVWPGQRPTINDYPLPVFRVNDRGSHDKPMHPNNLSVTNQ